MAISRADALTGSSKKLDLFSDFLNNFGTTPFGNQLGRVTNEQAIRQSLKNIIKTNIGERLFQPLMGSNVYKALFDPNDIVITSSLEFYIETAIMNWEPRVTLTDVIVEQDPLNDNGINITIYYYIVNNTTPLSLSMVLKRVR